MESRRNGPQLSMRHDDDDDDAHKTVASQRLKLVSSIDTDSDSPRPTCKQLSLQVLISATSN